MIPGLEKATLVRRKSDRDPTTGRTTTKETKSTIYVSIQPAPGEVIEHLPGGFRADDVKILYTRTRMFAVNPKLGQIADRIEFDDGSGVDQWEVQDVANWHKILPHHEVTVTRLKEPG